MAVARLDRTQWGSFFDHATQILAGKHTEIEIVHPALGHQVEVNRLPLLGMSYDASNDTIGILLEGIEHIINHPLIIYIDHAPGLAVSLQIIDTSGVQQIIVLRDPPMLPKPSLY